jgi:hypothetical protein
LNYVGSKHQRGFQLDAKEIRPADSMRREILLQQGQLQWVMKREADGTTNFRQKLAAENPGALVEALQRLTAPQQERRLQGRLLRER